LLGVLSRGEIILHRNRSPSKLGGYTKKSHESHAKFIHEESIPFQHYLFSPFPVILS
jgi:hypothetical protein